MNLNPETKWSMVREICASHGVMVDHVLSRRRERKLIQARIAIATALRNTLGLTYQDIGDTLNRDHTSILHLLGRTGKSKDVRWRQ